MNTLNLFNTLSIIPLKDRKTIQKSTCFDFMFDKLNNYLTKKSLNYLVKNRQKVLPKIQDGLKVFDPTDLTNVRPVKKMYLGGGIDFAIDAVGWRTEVEQFFGDLNIVKEPELKKIAYNEYVDLNEHEYPLLLNPLRCEPDRDSDSKFSEMFTKWRKGDLNNTENESDWSYWVNIIHNEIKTTDLNILNFCDTNFVKYDEVAGDGTKGELQYSDWANHNLFLWLGDNHKVRNISPWTLPACTKILRTKEDAFTLLKTIKDNEI
jgi:hypothetical protein